MGNMNLNGQIFEQVESFKYLGLKRDEKLCSLREYPSIIASSIGFGDYSSENICCIFTILSSNQTYNMVV